MIVSDAAATELEVVVKEEGAGSFAGLNGESGESAILVVELEHAAKIDGADDIYVVKEQRLIALIGIVTFGVAAGGILEEKPGGLLQAAARVQQDLLARDFNDIDPGSDQEDEDD